MKRSEDEFAGMQRKLNQLRNTLETERTFWLAKAKLATSRMQLNVAMTRLLEISCVLGFEKYKADMKIGEDKSRELKEKEEHAGYADQQNKHKVMERT